MTPQTESWNLAALGLGLLSFAPGYLGGAIVRMRASPQRDEVLCALEPLNTQRIYPNISDEHLFGGLDLAATLKSGHIIDFKGLFDNHFIATLSMAERCSTELAAKLGHQLDLDAGHCIIALDEGAEEEEATPPALTERLPFNISPIGKMPAGWRPVPAGTAFVDPQSVRCSIDDLNTVTALASQFGIDSMRAPLLALRVARAHAAFIGHKKLDQRDIEVAVSLVYPQRATQIPSDVEPDTTPAPEPETGAEPNADTSRDIPEGDMLVDAVRALLPPHVLAGLVPTGTARRSTGQGAGQKRKGNRRGRPLPSRPGRLDGRNRIDLVATLRAAAPWQPIRRKQNALTSKLLIRPSDIRLKRYQEQSDRLLIFAVDASGSAAVSRLNEAKGAIELLLAQAYADRDHVALISFRGLDAEILLPPTRSLVQTKRRLANLPGGGGTPLATGLQQALLLALQSRGKGLTPTMIALTDGRANIALDGSADRARASADAGKVAQMIRSHGISSLVIDMSARPQSGLEALALECDGSYLALPRADAQTLTGAVSVALGV
ncbi:magnesium chelatase subunit D [Roseobacter sp. EG26]|uniref:magnesium chelatase subunit D n=1 Tax=Roseobacter sp. EG26 TaxID=3412477 RepID=UPI003CE45585